MVTRGVPQSLIDDLATGCFNPVALLEIDWPTAPVRLHSGHGEMIWNGHVWKGVGVLDGRIELPAVGLGFEEFPGALTLGGTDAEILSVIGDAKAAAGRRLSVYFGTVTEPAGTVVKGDIYKEFVGRVGGISASSSWQGDVKHVAVSVEIVSGRGARASGAPVHCFADQQRRDPTDTWARHLVAARQKTVALLQ